MKGSREDSKARRDVEEVATIVVDTALQLHRDLGPGLLETVYEAVLAKMLESRGLNRVVNKHTDFASSRLRVHQNK